MTENSATTPAVTNENHQLLTPQPPPGAASASVDEHPDQSIQQKDDANDNTTSTKKWGTHLMGAPANPVAHPDNQRAAMWKADQQQQIFFETQQPYIIHSPVQKTSPNYPFDGVANMFNSWSLRAETIGRNIWHNLRTGPSLSNTVCGKIGLTAKAISEGGFESLFKQLFQVEHDNEKLKKTFACYLSTTTGPVAGTLYLSTHRVGFCSDRPLSFTAPSGQEAWSYYKIMVPLGRISAINPVTLGENPTERYIEIVTIDEHEFWFMGFVNFDKASHHLLDSVSDFRAAENPVQE